MTSLAGQETVWIFVPNEFYYKQVSKVSLAVTLES